MVNINIYAHDGITSMYTGVGKIARESIRVLCRKRILPFEYRVNAITGHYNQNCLGFNPPLKEENEAWLEKLGGKLYESDNGSSGEISYGKIEHWKIISTNAAKIAKQIKNSSPDDTNINLCLDTPFASVARNYINLYGEDDQIFVWIPHSTVLIHKGDSGIKTENDYIPVRFAWEKESVDFSNQNKRVFVGFIGQFMKQHLLSEYFVNNSKLLDFTDGLDLQSHTLAPTIDPRVLKENYGISTQNKLFISFGRLEPYKGFDATIKVGGLLAKHGFQTVLIAQPYSFSDPIIEEYKKLFQEFNPSGIFIRNYPFTLPHSVIKLQNARILFVPSRAEPFGIVPEEARLNRLESLAIVCANNGGFVEQITDSVDGFLTNPENTQGAYQKILEIDATNPIQLKEIADKGFERLNRNYDLERNLTKSITNLFATTI